MDVNNYAEIMQQVITKTYNLAIYDAVIALASAINDTTIKKRGLLVRKGRAKEIAELAEEILSALPHRP